MPSTYTVTNAFEKMAVGENENTWGQRIDNTFDVLDQAIDGYATITLSTLSSSLTISNGELSQGRCRVIRFVGTLAGTATVQMPLGISKMYWLANDANQSLIFTIGGSQNVTLAPGVMKPVFVDTARTSVIDMLSWNGSLALATLSVTGSLTVTGSISAQVSNGTKFLASDTVSAPTITATTSLTAATASIPGTLNAGPTSISGNLTATGAISSASLSTPGTVVATGNIQSNGQVSGNSLSASTATVTTGNFTTLNTATLTATGRIQTNNVVHGGTLEGDTINAGTLNLGGNVNAANGGFANTVFANDYVRQGVPIQTFIQSVAASIAPLNGISSSGDWVVLVFGSVTGNRLQLAFGRGAKSHGEQIPLPPGHSYGSAKLLVSLNETPLGSIPLGHISVRVDSGGIVTALIVDTSGNSLGASADWIGVSWLTGY